MSKHRSLQEVIGDLDRLREYVSGLETDRVREQGRFDEAVSAIAEQFGVTSLEAAAKELEAHEQLLKDKETEIIGTVELLEELADAITASAG